MQDIAKESLGAEGSYVAGGLIETEDLKKIKDSFCDVADVFVFCADAKGSQLTELSGNPQEASKVMACVTRKHIEAIFKRICSENSLEEQVVEDTPYSNVKLAAISIKIRGKAVCSWLMLAVLQDGVRMGHSAVLEGITTVTTTKRMYMALKLLKDTCQKFMQAQYAGVTAVAQCRRNKSSELEMSESLRRIETFTGIVQFLESDDTIEEILFQILKLAGNYLNVSSNQIFRIHKSQEKVDLLAQWCNTGIASVFDQTQNIDKPCILYAKRPLTISCETSLTVEESEYMKKMHMKAVMVIPIVIGGSASMYVSFCECKKERKWQVDEIKFVNDAVKIMQSVITRRIQKNSLASSYEALEAILDNVGTAIYVKDQESGKILFGNRILKKTFEKELQEGVLDSLLDKGIENGNKVGNCEICHKEKKKWYDLYFTTINWVDGRKVALYAIYDITDKRCTSERLNSRHIRIS